MTSLALSELLAQIQDLGPVPDEEDDDALGIDPPASEEQVAEIAALLGGAMPDELSAFLKQSAGFSHTFLEFRPEPELMSADGLVRASHYGNGDGFALTAAGGCCRVWWAGHDPYFLVLWGHSLRGFLSLWLERARKLQSDGPEEAWRPTGEATPVRPGHDADDVLRRFADRLPAGSTIYDLRDAEPGIELPWEHLHELSRGARIERQDLLLAITPVPEPQAVEPVPPSIYLLEDLSAEEVAVLRGLPKGSLVVHERDMPAGGRIEDADYPDRDVGWRPPFHVVYPKRAWWKFW